MVYMTTLEILQGVHDWVVNKIADDLVNYYTKSETYTKSEVQQIVGAIKQFTYEVVATLPTASESTMNKIYLTPAPKSEDKNIKEEYITIRSGSVGSYTYTWEMLGTTSIDLSNYYTKGQTDSLLAAKQNTISDLSTIRSGAALGATALQPAAISAMVESPDGDVMKIKTVTAEEWAALVTKEPNTEYNIIES